MLLPERRVTRRVRVGTVEIGGGAPVAVQTMTKAPADDVPGTLVQIARAADAGCDIVRCAVPTVKHLEPFAQIVKQSPLPVVADIHFDARIALGALQAGAPKIRINPGNMADWSAIEEVVLEAKQRGAAIRIGVNSGSVKHKNTADARPTAQALAEEALEYATRFEAMGFGDIVLSLKSGEVYETVLANREVAARCDYPLHLGITAAGPEDLSMWKSAAGLGALLLDGIGDTIRLSFTGEPVREVIAGRDLLHALGLRRAGVNLLSCPTCGRCSVDLTAMVQTVRERLSGIDAPLTVAVMGCEVNGPGEAREADIGLACAGGRSTLFMRGEKVETLAPDAAIERLVAEVRRLAEVSA